ncbi:MAG: hypothetical protein SPL52_07125 [Fibrobacter sp.]|nr:hypothetical protein [Fibrobacter sp.]
MSLQINTFNIGCNEYFGYLLKIAPLTPHQRDDTFSMRSASVMKKTKSTFEKVMSDTKQEKAFEKEYAEFLQSEILLDVERKKKK